LIQPNLPDAHAGTQREIDSLVRAALTCGCASCRHAVEAWSMREQADETFLQAHADVARSKRLRFVIGKSAA
jgi:hypothetical protein